MKKKYRSFISHVHSAFEGPATMEGFCSEAAATGIDLVWFSDHDTRIVRCGEPFIAPPRVPVLADPPNPAPELWWHVVEGVEITPPFPWLTPPIGDMPKRFPPAVHAKPTRPEIETSEDCVRVGVCGRHDEWEAATLSLRAPGSRWARPLICRPRIELALDTDVRPGDRDRRLVVEVELGQRPPGHDLALLRYAWGCTEDLGDVFDLPFRDGRIHLDLAREAGRIGVPVDHLPHRLRVRLESRRGSRIDVRMRELALPSDRMDPEELLHWQAGRAEDLGRQHGVETFVGYELSGTGTHLVAYGHLPPLVEHRGGKPVLKHMDAARWLQEHGCVLSLNHPFSSVRSALQDGELRDRIVLRRAREIREHDAYGAQLLEVGFPVGRQGFAVSDYLALWDRLSGWGIRLYGVGVSDAHANYRWNAGNNFANYVPVKTGSSSAEWVAALAKGDMFMADPARFRGAFDMVTDRDVPMGGEQSDGTVFLQATGLPPGCTLRWVMDGESAGEASGEGEEVRGSIGLDRMKVFVRAEIAARDGRILLLTNPIWAER